MIGNDQKRSRTSESIFRTEIVKRMQCRINSFICIIYLQHLTTHNTAQFINLALIRYRCTHNYSLFHSAQYG